MMRAARDGSRSIYSRHQIALSQRATPGARIRHPASASTNCNYGLRLTH
jgi:hypothetical protein